MYKKAGIIKSIKLGKYKGFKIKIPDVNVPEEHINLINKVMREILDRVEIEYDEESVNKTADVMYKDLEQQIKERDLNMEILADFQNYSSVDELRQSLIEEVKTTYLELAALEEIAGQENIKLSDSEYEKVKINYIENNDIEDIDKSDEPEFRNSILYSRVVDFLVSENVAVAKET